MRVALVHDFLSENNGGAERVLAVLQEMWPDAPIYTLFYDKKHVPQFDKSDVHESFLSWFPGIKKHYRWFLPFMPAATETYDLSSYDVVISSASAFAKGVIIKPGTVHICYCHTPTRYLWSDRDEYVSDLRASPIVKLILPPLLNRLRAWDKKSVDRVTHFVANSQTVAARIQKYYGRDSTVIYPAVDTHLFTPSRDIGQYFVTGGRMVASKRFDLVIDVFNRLSIPLKIYGDGPELKRLQKKAKRHILFLGKISDAQKADVLAKARAFIHPQLEDFGITPVESMAAGRPVIAYGVGGATESVIPGKTGILFFEQSWEALLDAVVRFDAEKWNPDEIRQWAMTFDKERFKAQMQSLVSRLVQHT